MSKRSLTQILLTALGVIMILLGVINGEARLVMMKAVNICLECIGIG